MDIKDHKEIVDAYIALGYDLDRIAISKGHYQPDAAAVLHAYNFRLGPDWGDSGDDLGRFKKLPQEKVNEFIEAYYPGSGDVTLDDFLASVYPGWDREQIDEKRKFFSRKLTEEEQEEGKKAWKRLY